MTCRSVPGAGESNGIRVTLGFIVADLWLFEP
jgi:hypothetical protein